MGSAQPLHAVFSSFSCLKVRADNSDTPQTRALLPDKSISNSDSRQCLASTKIQRLQALIGL